MGTYLSHTQIPVRVQRWDEIVIGHGEEEAGARKQPRYSLPLILEWTGQGPQDGSQTKARHQASQGPEDDLQDSGSGRTESSPVRCSLISTCVPCVCT